MIQPHLAECGILLRRIAHILLRISRSGTTCPRGRRGELPELSSRVAAASSTAMDATRDTTFSALMRHGSYSWEFQKDPLHFTTFQASPTTWSVSIRANYNLRKRLRLDKMWARLLIRLPWSLKAADPIRINNRVRALVTSQLSNFGVISPINLELACRSLPRVWINSTEADFEFVRILFKDEMN